MPFQAAQWDLPQSPSVYPGHESFLCPAYPLCIHYLSVSHLIKTLSKSLCNVSPPPPRQRQRTVTRTPAYWHGSTHNAAAARKGTGHVGKTKVGSGEGGSAVLAWISDPTGALCGAGKPHESRENDFYITQNAGLPSSSGLLPSRLWWFEKSDCPVLNIFISLLFLWHLIGVPSIQDWQSLCSWALGAFLFPGWTLTFSDTLPALCGFETIMFLKIIEWAFCLHSWPVCVSCLSSFLLG